MNALTTSTFWSNWIWSALTAVLGFVFTGLLVWQYKKREKPHQIAWAVGFFLYGAAALMEAYSEYAQYWDPMMYRFYYVIAASLVGFLGLGTVYLIFKKRLYGHIFLGYLLVVLVFFLNYALKAQLIDANLVPGITVGGMAMPFSVRIFSFLYTIPGSIALLGGAIYSIIRFWSNKEYSYRVWANVYIAVGTLVIAGAGAMARSGRTTGLYPAEMIGAALLLWGFLKASTLKKGAAAVVSKRKRSLTSLIDEEQKPQTT